MGTFFIFYLFTMFPPNSRAPQKQKPRNPETRNLEGKEEVEEHGKQEEYEECALIYTFWKMKHIFQDSSGFFLLQLSEIRVSNDLGFLLTGFFLRFSGILWHLEEERRFYGHFSRNFHLGNPTIIPRILLLPQ